MHTLILIIALGIIVYMVERFIPMSPPFAAVFRIICVIVAIALLLQFLGVNLGLPRVL